MTFLTPWLLTGCLFAAIPVILHLTLRQKPKLLEFPALRFLRARQQRNERSLNLRHLVLLACRILLIILVAFLFARPSILQTWNSSTNGPVAAALVFDTSVRMNYRYNNQTILEKAREEGLWVLSRFPAGSELAVLDSQNSANAFSVDRSAAKYRIERLKTGPKTLSLSASLIAAAKLLGQSPLPGKELYIFTDQSESGWDAQSAAAVVNAVKSEKNIAVYIIDAGPKDRFNDSLDQVRLNRDYLAPGEDLSVDVDWSRIRPMNDSAMDRKIELYIDSFAGIPEKRGEQLLNSPSPSSLPELKGESTEETTGISTGKDNATYKDSSTDKGSSTETGNPGRSVPLVHETASETIQTGTLRFSVSGFEPGKYQGTVRLTGSDALLEDDVRFFSFEVGAPRNILIIVPSADKKAGYFIEQALSPVLLRQSQRSRFLCEQRDQRLLESDELSLTELNHFDAIFLLDPEPLSAGAWNKLAAWSASGKGLALFLGVHATPLDSFNSPEAQKILPGKLQMQARAQEGGNWLWPTTFVHPILSPFGQIPGKAPWRAYPLFRYWQLTDFAPGVNTVLRMNDLRPILLERPVGLGTVLTFTSPVGELPSVSGTDKSWNAFASSEAWPIFILVNQTADYLCQTQRSRLNYWASESAALTAPENAADRFRLVQKQNKTAVLKNEAKPTENDAGGLSLEIRTTNQNDRPVLLIPAPERAGNFWLGPQTAWDQADAGTTGQTNVRWTDDSACPAWLLSYNYAESETNLKRLTKEQLDKYWSGYPYSLNRERQQMEQNMTGGRIGWELFPVLVILLILTMAVETFLSCRFYQLG